MVHILCLLLYCLSGIMFFLTNIGKFTKRCCRGSLIPFLVMVCLFSLEALLFIFTSAHLLFPLAVLLASVILAIGTMDVFFHGPYMKQLSFLVEGMKVDMSLPLKLYFTLSCLFLEKSTLPPLVLICMALSLLLLC